MRLLAPGNQSPNRHSSAPLAVETQASPQTSEGIAGRAQTISRVRSCSLPNRTTSQTFNLSKDQQSAHGELELGKFPLSTNPLSCLGLARTAVGRS